jgi:RimJ/RimL family protein N-acetyltransferase
MTLEETPIGVALRPLRKSDSELLYEWIADRDLQILSAPYWPISEVDHKVWLDKTMQKQKDAVAFAIEMTNGVTIGICKLVGINWISRSAELQIRIGERAYQGMGLGTAAVQLLCDFGFRDLGLNRIQLHVFETNGLASRAYEKSGFTKEGIHRQAAYVDGKFVDILTMSRLASD